MGGKGKGIVRTGLGEADKADSRMGTGTLAWVLILTREGQVPSPMQRVEAAWMDVGCRKEKAYSTALDMAAARVDRMGARMEKVLAAHSSMWPVYGPKEMKGLRRVHHLLILSSCLGPSSSVSLRAAFSLAVDFQMPWKLWLGH